MNQTGDSEIIEFVLMDSEKRVIRQFLDKCIPGGVFNLPAPSEINLLDDFERFVLSLGASESRKIRLAVRLFDLFPIFSTFMCPFKSMNKIDAMKYLSICDKKRFPLDLPYRMLKTLSHILYCSNRSVQKEIGYDAMPYMKTVTSLPDEFPLPFISYPDVKDGEDIFCEVCIVGSGAGGSVVADELASRGFNVVIIEEGRYVGREEFNKLRPIDRIPLLYRKGGMTNTWGNTLIFLPLGIAVGGTTVVNSGTCLRTPEEVLIKWGKEFGIMGVEPDVMAPIFEEIENRLNVSPVTDDIMGMNGMVLRRGADALGLSHAPIRRSMRGCHGSGLCAFGCPLDAKLSMHLTYLPSAVNSGARIITNCRAERIIIKGSRVEGIEATIIDPSIGEERGKITIRSRIVIISAGAILTPVLLSRSGIKNKNIGKNLWIHPAGGVLALFDEEINGWKGVLQSYLVDEKMKEGIILEATFPPPGLSYNAGVTPYTGLRHMEFISKYRNLASVGYLISDSSPGRVIPLGKGFPLILYFVRKRDARKVLEAISLAAKIYFASGAREVYTMIPSYPVIKSPREAESIRNLSIGASDLHLSAYHPMGTCRMSEATRDGVTNSYGKVHGFENLYVADASLIPSPPGVNPQMTIMALSVRIARRIAKEGSVQN